MKGKASVLPGKGLSLGFTLSYLSLVVLIPLMALALRGFQVSAKQWVDILTDPQLVSAFRVSLVCAFFAAMLNGFFGFIIAWVLVRYRFMGRDFLDALVDIPFALPTAVAGIALTAVYAPSGVIGNFFFGLGLPIAFTPIGITLALSFIGLPFVVRTLQPVVEELDPETEEAAACLGANRLQTFYILLFPTLLPALITGMSLSFARSLGEYGSVIFISGNLPFRTEIVPLIIAGKLERFDYEGATVVAIAMLLMSFAIMLGINILQRNTGAGKELR